LGDASSSRAIGTTPTVEITCRSVPERELLAALETTPNIPHSAIARNEKNSQGPRAGAGGGA
jgi:hypothetical protein